MHHDLSNTITTTRHDDNLLAPHICVVAPVVRDGAVEPAADAVQHAQPDQRLEVLEERSMVFSDAAALGGVARKQKKRDGQGWVQHSKLEKATKRIASHA
jgi:hypothetical protein